MENCCNWRHPKGCFTSTVFHTKQVISEKQEYIKYGKLEEISDTQGGGAQAAGQAGGGHEGGAQGDQVSEAGAEAQAPPQPPRAAPRLTSMQDEGVKE